MRIVSFKMNNDQRVFFGVTHLEFEIESVRLDQVKQIIEFYRKMGLENESFILTGDFNDEPTSKTMELLLGEGGFQLLCDACPKTYSTSNPSIMIDYILMNSKAREMFQLIIYRTSEKERSSDHFPLIVELKIE